MYLLLSVLPLLASIGALADIITIDSSRIRHLDKIFWIIIVILVPLIGVILWFTVGREYTRPVDRGSFGDPRRWQASPVTPPRSTEDELAALEREIAEDRIRRLEEELRARRRAKGAEG